MAIAGEKEMDWKRQEREVTNTKKEGKIKAKAKIT